MAQQRPNVEKHLSDEARARLTLMIDKNGQTDPQVRAICVILKDAIELPIEEIHDNLIEMLPVDVLYVAPCFGLKTLQRTAFENSLICPACRMTRSK